MGNKTREREIFMFQWHIFAGNDAADIVDICLSMVFSLQNFFLLQ